MKTAAIILWIAGIMILAGTAAYSFISGSAATFGLNLPWSYYSIGDLKFTAISGHALFILGLTYAFSKKYTVKLNTVLTLLHVTLSIAALIICRIIAFLLKDPAFFGKYDLSEWFIISLLGFAVVQLVHLFNLLAAHFRKNKPLPV